MFKRLIARIKLKWETFKWSFKSKVISKKLSFFNNKFDVYVLEVENTSYEPKKAVLFGYNSFFHARNFGSDEGIKITNTNVKHQFGYAQMLCETQLDTKIERTRIFTHEQSIGKLPVIWHVRKRAFGWVFEDPIHAMIYMDAYQQQPNIIDVTETFNVNGNVHFEMELKPQQKITLCFFGNKKIKPAKEPCPIIIQTVKAENA